MVYVRDVKTQLVKMAHAYVDLKDGEECTVKREAVLDGVQIVLDTEPVIVLLEYVTVA
jgi:hypothetical protein